MKTSLRAIDPVEIWARRHLIWMLSVREIKTRYKQSMLGWMWAVIRPLAVMVSFTYLFGAIAKLDTDGAPYPIYVFAAQLAWDVFASIVLGCTTSVTANRVIVERVYCPRLVFPLSTVLVALFDFLISSALFCVLLLVYGYAPSANILWLPLLIVGVILAGLSVGLWLAALAVWLRDMRFFVNYIIQVLMLLTPVGYGAANVPENFSFMIDWNPMATFVELFRWALLSSPLPDIGNIYISASVMLAFLVGGLMFFNALERSFADVI